MFSVIVSAGEMKSLKVFQQTYPPSLHLILTGELLLLF